MAVTETLRALGGWNLQLRPEIPDDLWKAIDYYGHITVHVGAGPDPRIAGDSLLRSSRYTGVVVGITEKEEQRTLSGSGMAYWLGDSDNKGDIIETLLEFNAATLEDVASALLPVSGAVEEGTFYNTGKTFTGSIQFMSPREAIDYVMQTKDAAWRVNGDATLDIGLESDLFIVNPTMVVARKNITSTVASLDDMFLRGLGGNPETARDVQDLTTRVLLMAQGSGGQFASATADAPPGTHPWTDLHGNPIKFTRIVQESETDAGNAEARAQLQLNRFLGTRDALTLTSGNYDIKGDGEVGDYIFVYDPTMGLVDVNNEAIFRSERINPIKLRLTEATWPVTSGMAVHYRSYTGDWFDLTDYIIPEIGDTTLVVGGYNRALTDGGSGAFPVTPPEVNTTIPGVPTWVTPFTTGVYQSPQSGETKAQVDLSWTRPDNTDASTMTDGDYFEIRYRTATTPLYAPTHAQLEAHTYAELEAGTAGEPLTYPVSDWASHIVPWDSLTTRLTELTPSMPYEAQIRAVDNGRPPNVGDWSLLTEFQAARDTLPPTTPAAPEVAASMIQIQVVHRLGKASGGTFNLEPDLAHLEIHGGPEPLYTPNDDTLLGKTIADWGMITGEIPAVASFQINSLNAVYFKTVAVDLAGNKSLPSPAVSATAELIDEQHVASLSVSKLTAGVMTADVINAASIKTANTGARVELNYRGLQAYSASNLNTLNLKSDDGTMDIWGDGSVNVRGAGSVNVLGSGSMNVTGGGNIEVTDGSVRIYNAAGIKICELGECTDGRHGLQVFDDNGVRTVRIGELSSTVVNGIEGINDLGQLVYFNTIAFGTASATASGYTSVNNPSYGAAAGGPSVVGVSIGSSGRMLVSIGAHLLVGGGSTVKMSFIVTTTGGTPVLNPADVRSVFTGGGALGAGRTVLVTGLAAGAYNITARYETNIPGGAITPQVGERNITVQPF